MVTIRTRGRLPHWEAPGGIYFVTFRLADSLPREAVRRIRFERRDIPATARVMGRKLSPEEQKRLRALQTRQVEKLLDRGAGSCVLANPRIAHAMSEVLGHFDGSRYELFAWCVMPNHVHAVVRPLGGHALSEILHSWKSYSVRIVNQMLGKSGSIWQREYYDHLVRDEEDFQRCVRYVSENPRKAGLRDWPWIGSAVRTQ